MKVEREGDAVLELRRDAQRIAQGWKKYTHIPALRPEDPWSRKLVADMQKIDKIANKLLRNK